MKGHRAQVFKLGAFGHASFIFKKRDHHHHLFKKKSINISKNRACISKLGAYDHASSILKKKKKKKHLFLKSQDFQKSCINLQTRGIWPCLIHFQKKEDHHHLFKIYIYIYIINEDSQKSCFNLQTRGIQLFLI